MRMSNFPKALKMYMKPAAALLLGLVLTLAAPAGAFASENSEMPDLSRSGSISVTFKNPKNGKPVGGENIFALYKVADVVVDNGFHFVYRDKFAEADDSLSEDAGLSAELAAKLAKLADSRGIVLKLIMDGELTIGLGSDIVAGVQNVDGWREFKCWRDLGIPALRTLVAATSDNAKIVGREDLGVLAPGKLADITAWNSDVAGDHCALEGSNCTFVMKEGIVYKRS